MSPTGIPASWTKCCKWLFSPVSRNIALRTSRALHQNILLKIKYYKLMTCG